MKKIMKLENVKKKLGLLLKKIDEYVNNLEMRTKKIKAKMYETKLKVFKYIHDDYGIDLFRIGDKIKALFTNPKTIKIIACIMGPILCIGFTGSMMILTLAYPIASMIWIMISILLIIYTFRDETVADKIYRFIYKER